MSLIRRIDLPGLVSTLLAGLLVFVGAVRVLSYFPKIAERWLYGSFLGFLAYQPESIFSVRYFKIIASLTAISLLYFVFRFFNHGHRTHDTPGYESHHRDIDFSSPWLRLTLLVIISLHWILVEWYKFATMSYPYSPLENWKSNAVVLALSGLIAFFGMKYLSFRPLLKEREPAAHAVGRTR